MSCLLMTIHLSTRENSALQPSHTDSTQILANLQAGHRFAHADPHDSLVAVPPLSFNFNGWAYQPLDLTFWFLEVQELEGSVYLYSRRS